jgi:hypothetical protein
MSFIACGLSLLVLPLPYLNQAIQTNCSGSSTWNGFLFTELAYMSIFGGLVYAHVKNGAVDANSSDQKSVQERRRLKRRRALERALLMQQSTQMSSLGSPTTAVAPVLPPIQDYSIAYQPAEEEKPIYEPTDQSPVTAFEALPTKLPEGLYQRQPRQRSPSNDSDVASVAASITSMITTGTRFTTMTTGSSILVPDGVDEVVIDGWIVRRNGNGGIQVLPREGSPKREGLAPLDTSSGRSLKDEEVYPMSGF